MSWFWVFMFFMEIMIPACMVVFGLMFVKSPPGNINGFFGYRTARSCSSKEAWDFAHKYFGRIWWKLGMVMLVISAAVMVPFAGKSDDAIGIAGTVICVIQIIVMLAPILFTERALKRNFDDKGKPLG